MPLGLPRPRIPKTKHAPAIILPIKILTLGNLNHALNAAALAPIEIPINKTLMPSGSPMPARVDLLHIFPTGNAKARGKKQKPMLLGIKSGPLQPKIKTNRTTRPAFWFHLQPLHAGEPDIRIIIGIYKRNATSFRKTLVFVLASLILVARVNVGIVKKHTKRNAALAQSLNNVPRARRATGMKKKRRTPLRKGQSQAFCHDKIKNPREQKRVPTKKRRNAYVLKQNEGGSAKPCEPPPRRSIVIAAVRRPRRRGGPANGMSARRRAA